jgi:SPP1 family predicted phage head-tail adaptor
MMKDRRHKVNFLSPPTGVDSYGAPTGSWTAFKSGIWASVVPILGNEYMAAKAAQTDAKVKIECDYFAGVLKTMRIQHGSDLYQILDVININNYNRDLLCYCKEVEQ